MVQNQIRGYVSKSWVGLVLIMANGFVNQALAGSDGWFDPKASSCHRAVSAASGEDDSNHAGRPFRNVNSGSSFSEAIFGSAFDHPEGMVVRFIYPSYTFGVGGYFRWGTGVENLRKLEAFLAYLEYYWKKTPHKYNDVPMVISETHFYSILLLVKLYRDSLDVFDRPSPSSDRNQNYNSILDSFDFSDNDMAWAIESFGLRNFDSDGAWELDPLSEADLNLRYNLLVGDSRHIYQTKKSVYRLLPFRWDWLRLSRNKSIREELKKVAEMILGPFDAPLKVGSVQFSPSGFANYIYKKVLPSIDTFSPQSLKPLLGDRQGRHALKNRIQNTLYDGHIIRVGLKLGKGMYFRNHDSHRVLWTKPPELRRDEVTGGPSGTGYGLITGYRAFQGRLISVFLEGVWGDFEPDSYGPVEVDADYLIDYAESLHLPK